MPRILDSDRNYSKFKENEPEERDEGPEGPPILDQTGAALSFFFKIITSPIRLLLFVGDFFSAIRNIIFTALTLLIIGAITLAYVIIYRPPNLWNPLKNFLNADLSPPQIKQVKIEDLYLRVNNDAIAVKKVVLSESDVSALFKERLALDQDVRVDLETEKILLLTNIDDAEQPLWLVAEFNVASDGKVSLDKVGFGRLSLPGQSLSFLNEKLQGIVSFLETQIADENVNLVFGKLLAADKLNKDLIVRTAKLDHDKVTITFIYDPQP